MDVDKEVVETGFELIRELNKKYRKNNRLFVISQFQIIKTHSIASILNSYLLFTHLKKS